MQILHTKPAKLTQLMVTIPTTLNTHQALTNIVNPLLCCSPVVVLFYVLFVLYRLCANVYYCHRVTTQLQLTNISYHIIHFINLQWIMFSGLEQQGVQIEVSENELLRKIFGPKTGEISEESGMCVARIFLILGTDRPQR